MQTIAGKVLVGVLAGAAATVPMTALMLELHRRLPRGERYALPPREIFDELVERAEVDERLRESDKTSLSIAGHFCYGAGCGALYSILVDKPNAANGAVYGLGVWTASYLGWLPALKILRPATEHPWRRNALMIAAHAIWGASLGEISRRANASGDK